MTGRHNPEVFHTTNRRLSKPGEGSGASSTAPLTTKAKVTSSRAVPLMEVGLYEGIGIGALESGGVLRKGRQ